MPEYPLTNVWSEPIELFAGQFLEVRGAGEIWVSENLGNPSYDDAAVVTLTEPLAVVYDMLVRARSGTIAGNTLAVIDGLDVSNEEPVLFGPNVLTGPGLTLGPDGILRRVAGTASGVPTPTRATLWEFNGEIVPNQTAEVYNPYKVPGKYRTFDVWTGAAPQPVLVPSEEITIEGAGEVIISKQPGNLLTMQPDGLFAAVVFETADW